VHMFPLMGQGDAMKNATTCLLILAVILLVAVLGILVRQRASIRSIERALTNQGDKISILYKIADSELDLESYDAKLEERTKQKEEEDSTPALEVASEYRNSQYTSIAAFCPEKPAFAVIRTTGEVVLVDAVEQREGLLLRQRGEVFTAFAFFPDGESMVLGTNAGKLYQANLTTGEIHFIRAFDSGREIARLDAGANDRIAIGLGGSSEQSKETPSGFVYDLNTGKHLVECNAFFRNDFQGLALSATGNVLAIDEVHGKLRGACLFRCADGQEINVLYDARYGSGPLSVAIGPDDTTVAAGYAPSDVIVWNGIDGTIKWLFEGHTNWVVSLAFSKDQRYLASGAGDSSARVYDLQTGKEIGRVGFPGPSTYVNSVDISSDGSWLLAAIDGYVGVYKMPKPSALP
jgi:WD40 repeat protein